MVRGDGEMNDPFTAGQLSPRDLHRHRCAAIAATGADYRIGSECGHDPERIPDANAPVSQAPGDHLEGGGDGTERVRRPDVPVIRGQDQNPARRQLPERLLDLLLRTAQGSSDLRWLRHASRLRGLSENVKPYFASERVI